MNSRLTNTNQPATFQRGWAGTSRPDCEGIGCQHDRGHSLCPCCSPEEVDWTSVWSAEMGKTTNFLTLFEKSAVGSDQVVPEAHLLGRFLKSRT